MRKSLRALSVKLPWSWLMFPDLINDPPLDYGSIQRLTIRYDHQKDIENRDYSTDWRGTIAIQCSKRIEREEIYQAERLIHQRGRVKGFQNTIPRIAIPTLQSLQRYAGKIIGTVDLVDCVEASDSPWFVGRYGWVLKNPISLPTPIPHRGSISPILWEVRPDVLAEINKQIGDKL